MEKVDRVVALVGALVLVVGVAVAAMSQGAQGEPYAVAPRLVADDASVALAGANQPGQPYRGEGALDLDVAGLHRVYLNVTLTPTGGFLSAGSAHVTLTAPNGTTYETEAPVPQGAAPVTLALDVPVAPLPAPREVAAPDDAARQAALDAMRTREGAGTWTLVVDYAPGPVPSPRVDVAAEGGVLRWEPEARGPAAPPEAK